MPLDVTPFADMPARRAAFADEGIGIGAGMMSVGVALFGLVDLMVTFKLGAVVGALPDAVAVPLKVVVGVDGGFADAAGVGVAAVEGTDVGVGVAIGMTKRCLSVRLYDGGAADVAQGWRICN